MMAECSCSFMVNLVAAFNEGPYLYLLMECIMGGELFTYLQVCGAEPLAYLLCARAAELIALAWLPCLPRLRVCSICVTTAVNLLASSHCTLTITGNAMQIAGLMKSFVVTSSPAS